MRIITIDGPDCTGKSTLWLDAINFNKNVQVRGIVSNIAYALKYGRNVDELITLYNISPIDFVVYLLNPSRADKIKMINNRLESCIDVASELQSLANTYNDMEYFKQAIDILKQKYLGTIIVIESSDNSLGKFKTEVLDKYETTDITEIKGDCFKILDCPDKYFEKEAKFASEYKYIVLWNKLSKDKIIDNLQKLLDEEHKEMFDNLLEYTSVTYDEIYDDLEEYTVDALEQYLEDYSLSVRVNTSCTVGGTVDLDINLKDLNGCRCIEDYIYDDSYSMDEIVDNLKENIYDHEIDIDVENLY